MNTYNAKGELATANATSNNAAVAAINRTFNFDAIGNRTGIVAGGTSTAYTSNALNQYTSITKTLADNTTETKTKVHDADGNVTNNGIHKYTFDAEDRLTEVRNQTGTILVSYRYDAYSRRIERTVPAGETTQYLYNSWNVIAEYKQLTASTWQLTTTRTWGLDISGSEQGAGGIGGLLAENQITSGTTTSYYPLYDGNGNITEYLDGAGAIVAHYEYDPFGKVNLSTGAKAGDFRYQFSTKPLDTITNLHYYGYRWYDASNGRWINRDPIKEDGGLNVYNFCNGDPINRVDVLGMAETGGSGTAYNPDGSVNGTDFRSMHQKQEDKRRERDRAMEEWRKRKQAEKAREEKAAAEAAAKALAREKEKWIDGEIGGQKRSDWHCKQGNGFRAIWYGIIDGNYHQMADVGENMSAGIAKNNKERAAAVERGEISNFWFKIGNGAVWAAEKQSKVYGVINDLNPAHGAEALAGSIIEDGMSFENAASARNDLKSWMNCILDLYFFEHMHNAKNAS